MAALSFFARVPIHCARCGYACQSIDDADRIGVRTITCLNAQCRQYNKPAWVIDPVMVLLTEAHDTAPTTEAEQ